MARTTLCLALFLTLVAGSARAESLFGASFFGGDSFLSDARTEGRGGMGLAYRDSINANVVIPTQLADMKRVMIGLSSQFTRREAKDDLGSITRLGLVSPNIRAGMPLGSRAGLGIGFEARRATQWTIVRPADALPTAEETLEREGTQFSIPIEVGVRVQRHVTVGLGVAFQRGTIRNRYSADLSGSLEDDEQVREDTLRGAAFKAAVAFDSLGPVSVAGFYVPEHDVEVDVASRNRDRTAVREFTRTDRFPARWGLGARVELSPRLSVGADYELEEWSAYRGRPSYEAALQDETELRLGLERLASPDGGRPLRLGGYWREWNYSLEGQRLTEWGATLGTGIPLRGSYTRLDLAIGYGVIGSLSDNGAREGVFRLMFSVSGGEKWY